MDGGPMLVIVGFVSQKGGVGKSTLSRALATSAAAAGTTVTVADLDVQQETLSGGQTVGKNMGPAPRSWRSYDTAREAMDLGRRREPAPDH